MGKKILKNDKKIMKGLHILMKPEIIFRAEQSRAEQSRAEQSRAAYIDVLRIIACLLVIFNHTNERGFFRYITDDLGTAAWCGNLFFSIICKSATPIFFMISGSMLLQREESILKTYKRILRILFVLLVFSCAYLATDAMLAGAQISVHDILNAVLSRSYWHLWYLYAYIALIVTVPFLRKMVKGLDVKMGIYIFIVALVIKGFIPILEYFWIQGINASLKPTWIISDIFFFPVIGYVLDNKLEIEKVKRNHIVILCIISLCCIAISEICEFFYLKTEPGNASETFLQNFWFVNSTMLFLLVKYIFKKTKMKNMKKTMYAIITEIGKCTFGIYLFHIWFLWKIPLFYHIWVAIEQNGFFGKYGGVFISCVSVFLVAGIATWLLRHIPAIRKLL